jgi:signal transduction histidine kinase/ActR/RegA family two-component response regulator
MPGYLEHLFSSSGFMPHGMCYLWRSDILALHVLADSLITLAYFSIPPTLLYFVRRRQDLQFNWVFVCFAIFIIACGTTHLMEIVTIWRPMYWLSGLIKAITALASVPTAVMLVRLVPEALRWPSPAALQRANSSLELEIAERKRAEAEVRRINDVLEIRVAERTRELETAYENLRETQQASMQQERLRSLGRMASGIAHDINNALTPATLYTQSLLDHDKSLGTEARNDLTVVLQAIDDVAQTVSRIKEFYRGRDANAVHAPIDIRQVLEQVVELTRARWVDMPQQRGFVIDVRVEHSMQVAPIMGVQAEIRDALTNLVLNAVDSMPEGGTLTLRSYGAQHHVTVEVGDTGVGMTEEVRARCLDPFFTTKGERGTGLGLAMVYGMAERHNAELEIDSELRAGTVVRLVFPIAPTNHATVPTPSVSQRRVTDLRILVIDDDELLRQSMRAILEREGHRVTVAHGGRSGIDLFTGAFQRGEGFDTVITDLGMPHVDGRAVAAAVKSVSRDTPVILLTGWGQHLRDGNEIPAYVDHILNKPANLAELRSALAESADVALAATEERHMATPIRLWPPPGSLSPASDR